MYCPKCGTQNPNNVQSCNACGAILTPTLTTTEPITPKTSGLAIAALVLGIMSIFTCLLTGVPSIICGIISLVKIEKSGGRITGKGFAISGIILPVIVVPVVALLMGILIPTLNRARMQARAVVCQSNLKQWGTIFLLYTQDNDGKFNTRYGDSGRWPDTMLDYYIGTEEILLCPVATKIANPDMTPGLDYCGNTTTAWGKIPASNGRKESHYGSYGINGYVYVPGEDPLYKPAERFWRTPHVNGAGEIPMFLECYFWCGWPDDDDTPPEYYDHQIHADENSMNRFCMDRHNGFANTLFLDFSVRKVGLKELWTLNWHKGFNRTNAWTLAGGVEPTDWPQWMRNFKDY